MINVAQILQRLSYKVCSTKSPTSTAFGLFILVFRIPPLYTSMLLLCLYLFLRHDSKMLSTCVLTPSNILVYGILACLWNKHRCQINAASFGMRNLTSAAVLNRPLTISLKEVWHNFRNFLPWFLASAKISNVIPVSVSFWPLLIIESVARVSQHVLFTHDLLVN